jgi:hypothetical protein
MKKKKLNRLTEKSHKIEYRRENGPNGKVTNFVLNSPTGWVFVIALAIIATICIVGIYFPSSAAK